MSVENDDDDEHPISSRRYTVDVPEQDIVVRDILNGFRSERPILGRPVSYKPGKLYAIFK